jgi:hypothetical protein
VVDAAVNLFSILLPLQDGSAAARILSQLIDSVKSPKLERNAGRRAAVTVNAVVALVLMFREATVSPQRRLRETLGSSQVTSLLANFLKVVLLAIS